MKNLKQVLALGMAFSLTMSTMAGAAFSDSADIDATEAVDMLSALGVITGYEDGSFKPDGTVTRAEAAKMIFAIRNNGSINADSFKNASTTFTDIQGHWAEGYIKFCQTMGVIAGKSATTFDPNGNVTGVELAKMMLVTLGYDAEKAGIYGPTWATTTLALASENGLLKGVDADLYTGLPRQYAAQLMYNALLAPTVRWSTDGNAYTDLGVDNMPNETVGYKYMDLTVYTGTLASSGDLAINADTDGDGNLDGVVSSAGKDRFTVVVDTVNDVDVNKLQAYNNSRLVTFKDGLDHTDLVGQEVKILTGDKIDEVYGIYATGTSKVVETTMDKIEVDTNNDKFIIGDVKYSVDDTAPNTKVYTDGTQGTVSSVFTSGGQVNGKIVSDKVKMIDNDNNGKYETIMVETTNVAKITYIGTESITIGQVGSRNATVNNNAVIENSDMTIYDGAAKGDYVVITRDDYNTDKYKVEKATVVTGTVNGIVDNDRKVRVDGTWYTLANDKLDTDNDNKFDLCTIPGTVEKFVNKDQVTLYVVGDVAYYAESTKGNDVNRSVAMVYDKGIGGNWNTTNQANIILPDGTTKTVNVDSDSPVTYSSLVKGTMYSYTVDNDGDYHFSTLVNGTNMAGYDYYGTGMADGSDNVIRNGKIGTYTIADDAIVFAYDDNDDSVRVYTGKSVKDAKLDLDNNTAAQILVQESTGGLDYIRIMAVKIDTVINTSTNYGYLVTDAIRSYNSELGCYVMEYTYWNGTEVVNAIEKTDVDRESWAIKGKIISFANDAEGFIKDVKEPSTFVATDPDKLNYATMTGVDTKAGYVALSHDGGVTKNTYEVTSDTLIYYVNSDASSSEKIGVVSSGYDYVVKTGLNNVAYVKDSNGKILFMVIDVDGELE